MICIKCNKEKNCNEMYYNQQRMMRDNTCISCKRDAMHLYNMERVKNQKQRTILHLRNIIRNMIEACEDKDSKKLRLWADIGRLELGKIKSVEKRWSKVATGN